MDFNKVLDAYEEKEIYVRIISLNHKELPREQILGRVTGGSINIDGASAVRRSCSLNLVALEDDTIITDEYWSFNSKFKLQIGQRNYLNKEQPDIIWYDKGIYIITSFSSNTSENGLTVSLQGKDKMCRLDGSVSGSLPISTDFGTEEIVEEVLINDKNGEPTGQTTYQTTINKLPLSTIIRNAVKEYGQETDENIIIEDLGNYGYELWEYRGDTPMYIFLENNEGKITYKNFTFDDSTTLQVQGTVNKIAIKEFTGKFYSLNTLDKNYNDNATVLEKPYPNCYIAKIEYGETAGYHQTPLVYNGDLVLAAGETVVALLTKITDMLGNYEFYYDLQGRFRFCKKQTYTQELFSPINGDLYTPTAIASPYVYEFKDYKLFKSISYTPQMENIKNEFSVWGARKSATGDDLPIHARYAIQKKPSEYRSPYEKYEQIQDLWHILVSEVTEDDLKATIKPTFYRKWNNNYIPSESNPQYKIEKTKKLPTDNQNIYHLLADGTYKLYTEIPTHVRLIGESDKDKYVEYVQGEKYPLTQYRYYQLKPASDRIYNIQEYDWRELIYQMAIDYYAHHTEEDFLYRIENFNPTFTHGRTGYEQYYSDMQGFWRDLYNPNPSLQDIDLKGEFYGITGSDGNGEDRYWNKIIHHSPHNLNFWFDFLDVGGEISNYAVEKIGSRTKVENGNNNLRSIYYYDIPEILYHLPSDPKIDKHDTAYQYMQIPQKLETLFYRSAQGQSIIDKVNTLFNTHVMQSAGLNLTTIPIFYLEPNTRIYVEGYGDYTISTISLSLAHDGTMSLTCTKVMTSII